MNFIESLNEYMSKVFDSNGDGAVSVKEVFVKLSHSAPLIALLVADILVIVAEYRVWDMGMTMTGNNAFKALGFVLVSAVPYYLAQVLWIYPRGNWYQKAIALLMGIGGLTTSAIFGRADLFFGYDFQLDEQYLLNMVILLTVAYIVALLVYSLIDPGVRAWFAKVKARSAADQEREFLKITRSIMEDMRETQRLQKELEKEFGDAEAVQNQMARLKGNAPRRPQEAPQATKTPQLAVYPAETQQVEPGNPTSGGNKQ